MRYPCPQQQRELPRQGLDGSWGVTLNTEAELQGPHLAQFRSHDAVQMSSTVVEADLWLQELVGGGMKGRWECP
jgi:hypothetical protein